VSHSKQALARGYAVLALEPNDDRVLCWSSSDRGRYVNDQSDVSRGWGDIRLALPAREGGKWTALTGQSRRRRGGEGCTDLYAGLAAAENAHARPAVALPPLLPPCR
jgi:hypothetical protein